MPKANPGGGNPISRQGGRKGGGGKSLKGTNAPASWPSPAGSNKVSSGKGNPGGKGPLSGFGGGKGGSRSQGGSGGAPGASGGNGGSEG